MFVARNFSKAALYWSSKSNMSCNDCLLRPGPRSSSTSSSCMVEVCTPDPYVAPPLLAKDFTVTTSSSSSSSLSSSSSSSSSSSLSSSSSPSSSSLSNLVNSSLAILAALTSSAQSSFVTFNSLFNSAFSLSVSSTRARSFSFCVLSKASRSCVPSGPSPSLDDDVDIEAVLSDKYSFASVFTRSLMALHFPSASPRRKASSAALFPRWSCCFEKTKMASSIASLASAMISPNESRNASRSIRSLFFARGLYPPSTKRSLGLVIAADWKKAD